MSGLDAGGAGGLGALWAWLRGSSDSLSSAGSARTTGSFVFRVGTPSTSPPPTPILYRQKTRDTLTLHRKYGLLRDPLDVTLNRCSIGDPTVVRDRRAVSESLQRRSVHVPGKRRAPQPPVLTSATLPHASHRRYGRKRPAPKPPILNEKDNKNTNRILTTRNIQHNRDSMSNFEELLTGKCTSDKNVTINKENKYRTEKNFLKKIFESRKRSSFIETERVKILPSIRELDIQAMEIIEARKKMKQINSQTANSGTSTSQDNGWVCKKCLRKHPLSTFDCINCQLDNNKDKYNSKVAKSVTKDDKEKLRQILKEMKDSLPKHTKYTDSNSNKKLTTETPTLRIGSIKENEINRSLDIKSDGKLEDTPTTSRLSYNNNNNVLVSQTVVLHDIQHSSGDKIKSHDLLHPRPDLDSSSTETKPLHTPLRISTLLNPVYIPKEVNKKETVRLQNSGDNIKIDSKEATSEEKNKIKVMKENQPCCKSDLKTNEELVTAKVTPKVFNDIDVKIISDHSKRRNLIKQLEKSISEGDERSAAEAATKLAQLRLSCSVLSFASQIIADKLESENNKVFPKLDESIKIKAEGTKKLKDLKTDTPPITSSPSTSRDQSQSLNSVKKIQLNNTDENILIQVWVEDKVTTKGPISLPVRRNATLQDLKIQAEITFGFAVTLQRWIVGNKLCINDDTLLSSLAGVNFTSPFYLCLVKPDNSGASTSSSKEQSKKPLEISGASEVYSELVRLEKRPIVTNNEPFECGICLESCLPGNGAVLRECIHTFCNICLADSIRHCEEAVVSCPATACDGILQEREIRALVSTEEYERWLARGLTAAESGTKNSFHCRTRDCSGWALCDPGVRKFPCPVCKHNNCVPCQAIHEGETCERYQEALLRATAKANADPSLVDDSTKALLDSLIAKGEALECPECNTILTKKWGCDWVKCSACKTEICWVTKGRRWGPAGRGDTSAGCKCGVDGKRCHPSCGYCH